MLNPRNKSHYGELLNGKNNKSPNNNLPAVPKNPINSKFYGDFLTLTPRRSKMNEYLSYHQQQVQQQSQPHEPYEQITSPKYKRNYYQNQNHFNHSRNGSTGSGLGGGDNTAEHSYLNSLDTLKLDEEHNILHSKLFYQNDSSGNEYVINNGGNMKKQHVVTSNVNNTNIVSPPNQFSNDSNINRFIKL